MARLPLTPVINVIVDSSPQARGVQSFDLGLIIGVSTTITPEIRTT